MLCSVLCATDCSGLANDTYEKHYIRYGMTESRSQKDSRPTTCVVHPRRQRRHVEQAHSVKCSASVRCS